MQTTYTDKDMELIHGYCKMEVGDMNIIDAIIFLIFKYFRIAKWSNAFKGECIKLSMDNTKAEGIRGTGRFPLGPGHSVRADFCIERRKITSWELEIYQNGVNGHFYGVITKQQNFDGCPFEGVIKDAYGIGDWRWGIYEGTGQRITIRENDMHQGWNKPCLPEKEIFKLKMIADWTDGKQCKLSIFYNEKKMNESNDEYTFILPELKDKRVWYPCVTPFYKGSFCIIRYCQ